MQQEYLDNKRLLRCWYFSRNKMTAKKLCQLLSKSLCRCGKNYLYHFDTATESLCSVFIWWKSCVPLVKDTVLKQNGAFGAEYCNFQPGRDGGVMEHGEAGGETVVRCISTEYCGCGGAAARA